MVAAGLQKTSMIDYPGKISCVIFLSGCNFCCPYCHNPELARGLYPERLELNRLMDFITERRSLLEGVVISGGEPTLQPDLIEWCRALRQAGLAVKLDTNGSRPQILANLIRESALDYIAMDVKTAPALYGPPLCAHKAGAEITESIDLVMQSGLPYEFRTTCVRPFVDHRQIANIGRSLAGARQWTLQTFHATTLLEPAFSGHGDAGFSPAEMQALRLIAAPWVAHCQVR